MGLIFAYFFHSWFRDRFTVVPIHHHAVLAQAPGDAPFDDSPGVHAVDGQYTVGPERAFSGQLIDSSCVPF